MRLMTVLTLVAVTACSSAQEERPTSGSSVADLVGDWSTDLQPMNASGIRGEVKLQSALAGMGITISVSGAPNGAHLPWHVPLGTCGSGGDIVGDASSYPPLHVGADGSARLSTTVSTPLNERERYYVNVHRSATELAVIVACGNLRN
jgi:hypothetical protein